MSKNCLYTQKFLKNPLCRPVLWLNAAAFLSVLGFIWLCFELGAEGRHTRQEVFFNLPWSDEHEVRNQQEKDNFLLPLQCTQKSEEIFEHAINLHTSSLSRLQDVSKLGIKFSSSARAASIISAEILIKSPISKDTIQLFDLSKAQDGFNNQELKLNRTNSQPNILDQYGEITLRVVTNEAANFSIQTQRSAGNPLSTWLWAPDSNSGGEGSSFVSVAGWFLHGKEGIPRYTRAELLAYVWGFGTGRGQLVYLICAAAAVLWLAGLIFSLKPNLLSKVVPTWLGLGIGTCLLILSVLTVNALIFPPFHGPDESDHALGFANVVQDCNLAAGLLSLAHIGHFDRIVRNANEHFAAIDVNEPLCNGWADYIFPTNLGRSPLVEGVWKIFDLFIRGADAGLTILALRFLNGSFVALCVLVSVAAYAYASRLSQFSIAMAAPIILVPSLGFYSTMVSNYPFLIGGYLLQGAGLLMLWMTLNDANNLRAAIRLGGLLAGLGLGIALCTADNAIGVISFWLLIIPAFLFSKKINPESIKNLKSEIYEIFIPFSAGITSVCLAVGLMSPTTCLLPTAMSELLGRCFGFAEAPMQFLAIFCYLALLMAISIVAVYLKNSFPKVSCFNNLRWLAALMLLGIVLVTALLPRTQVPNIAVPSEQPLSAVEYVCVVLPAFVKGFFPGNADPMIVRTFWLSLGWLDYQVQPWIMETLRFFVGGGALALLVTSFVKSSFPKVTFFALSNIGAVLLCLSVLAIAYQGINVNLTSRYLISPYVFFIFLSLEGFRRILKSYFCNNLVIDAVPHFLMLFGMAIYSSAWITTINRYF